MERAIEADHPGRDDESAAEDTGEQTHRAMNRFEIGIHPKTAGRVKKVSRSQTAKMRFVRHCRMDQQTQLVEWASEYLRKWPVYHRAAIKTVPHDTGRKRYLYVALPFDAYTMQTMDVLAFSLLNAVAQELPRAADCARVVRSPENVGQGIPRSGGAHISTVGQSAQKFRKPKARTPGRTSGSLIGRASQVQFSSG